MYYPSYNYWYQQHIQVSQLFCSVIWFSQSHKKFDPWLITGTCGTEFLQVTVYSSSRSAALWYANEITW